MMYVVLELDNAHVAATYNRVEDRVRRLCRYFGSPAAVAVIVWHVRIFVLPMQYNVDM
jgi:hypothetical protein